MIENKTKLPCFEDKDTNGKKNYLKETVARQILSLYEKSARNRCQNTDERGQNDWRSQDRQKKLQQGFPWAIGSGGVHIKRRAENWRGPAKARLAKRVKLYTW